VTMRLVTEIISTKRSAHHAFIAWLGRNTDKPLAFFNNVIPSAPPKLRELSFFNATRNVGDDARLRMLLDGDCDALVNFEGKLPASIERWNRDYLLPRLQGKLQRIVFLRDPINTLASLAKRGQPTRFRGRFNFFYQALGIEEMLTHLHDNPSGLCDRVVIFSRWRMNADYRAKLAGELGLKGSDLPSKISPFGGGSSFGGMNFDPVTQVAELFERWRMVEDNPMFLAPFADQASQIAMRYYFSLAGATEIVKPGVLDDLIVRAGQSAEAKAYARDFLQPLRRARGQILRMEHARASLLREAWKGAIRARMALRV
jgi:hypothetical protein